MKRQSQHTTDRLMLRQWKDSDHAPFAALNADPEVMRHFPATLSEEESDNLARGNRALINLNGWGLWAVEETNSGQFTGFVGLKPVVNIPYCAGDPQNGQPPKPGVEIAWRLAKEFWGYGFAQEAARECLRLAFEELALPEVISFTTLDNQRSRRVMQEIGMRDLEQNFNHPQVPVDSGLQEHVLYRISREEFLAARG